MFMKFQNFVFNEDLIAVDIDGSYLDLHNNYKFISVIRKSNEVELHWSKLVGDWVESELPESITFKILDVKYFDIRGSVESGSSLEEVGFFLDFSLGKVEFNGSNKPYSDANVLVFRFIGGAEVAIIGSSIKCLIC